MANFIAIQNNRPFENVCCLGTLIPTDRSPSWIQRDLTCEEHEGIQTSRCWYCMGCYACCCR